MVHAETARTLRHQIHGLLRGKNQTVFTSIPDDKRRWLTAELTLAAIRAQFGLNIAQGSRTKRTAWSLDVFTFDVCHALWRAGVPIVADPDPEASHAQALAKQLATLIGLPGSNGTFYNQMRRARHFLLGSGPDDGVAEAWLDGRLTANLLTNETIDLGGAKPAEADAHG
jgi:hypothetical protein